MMVLICILCKQLHTNIQTNIAKTLCLQLSIFCDVIMAFVVTQLSGCCYGNQVASYTDNLPLHSVLFIHNIYPGVGLSWFGIMGI